MSLFEIVTWISSGPISDDGVICHTVFHAPVDLVATPIVGDGDTFLSYLCLKSRVTELTPVMLISGDIILSVPW